MDNRLGEGVRRRGAVVTGTWGAVFFALNVIIFSAGCGGGESVLVTPEVDLNDQTFSLLVCDGNNNTPWSWGHDGAAACTLDWNNDGAGPNRVPVYYAYDGYPIVDGLVTKTTSTEQGDDLVWGQVPWTTIKTGPIYAGGSGVTEVKVKALYTYVEPPRIWFLFQWEDPSHTVCADDVDVPKGVMQYYWLSGAGARLSGGDAAFERRWLSREDWLALVWSTWFLWNTKDKGKADKNTHSPADPNGYDWQLVETVPGFQQKGVEVCKGSGDTVYKTPAVSSSDPNSPYYDKYFPGAFCDMWFFSASRSNFVGGGWAGGAAPLFDCYIDNNGFQRPPTGTSGNPQSLDETLTLDAGVVGYEANGGVTGGPAYVELNYPSENPPGPFYLWKDGAKLFGAGTPPGNGCRVAGYLHRTAYGSVADVVGRASWEDLTMWRGGANGGYDPYSYWGGQRPTPNEIGKDWNYTLEIEREIGSITKNAPTEDTLLGLFEPHPGK